MSVTATTYKENVKLETQKARIPALAQGEQGRLALYNVFAADGVTRVVLNVDWQIPAGLQRCLDGLKDTLDDARFNDFESKVQAPEGRDFAALKELHRRAMHHTTTMSPGELTYAGMCCRRENIPEDVCKTMGDVVRARWLAQDQ